MTLLAMEFLRPERLWALALLPVLAIGYLLLSGRQGRAQVASRLKLVVPKDQAWKRHGAVLLSLASMAALVIAWAMPKDYAMEPRDRATIVVAIDVSWSMEATDVEPDRLSAAKESAKIFVKSLPERFNVSLVSFSGTASVVVPPTVDRGALVRAIDALEMGPSTAIGEGIYMSLQSLTMVPKDPNDPDAKVPAAIVMLSDGATNIGRSSLSAATVSKERGVPIYAIAYGTQNGWVESNGERQRVAVDHYELSEVARASGGKKFSAESAGELREIYEAIRSDVGYEKVPTEITDRYAGLAIVFAVLAALGAISLGARWP